MYGRIFCLLMLLAGPVYAQSFSATPLNDLGTGTYLNFEGGLYENGTNVVPTDHSQDGLSQVAQVVPINGLIGFLSIGMSNAADTFTTFIQGAATNPGVNHTTLAIVNGAQDAAVACFWTVANGLIGNKCPGSSQVQNEYDRVKQQVLAPAHLSEQQVQVIWLYNADPYPVTSLPSLKADAFSLEAYLGGIARAARQRYPNLKLMFLSSREYGGYAKITLNPEPYAYESGFSVKWLIQAQINQIRTGQIDPIAGDLDYNTGAAPWLVWSAYTWANGMQPRSDGLIWCNGQPTSPCLGDIDVKTSDGTHPSLEGRADLANLLTKFFLDSSYAPWFRASGE